MSLSIQLIIEYFPIASAKHNNNNKQYGALSRNSSSDIHFENISTWNSYFCTIFAHALLNKTYVILVKGKQKKTLNSNKWYKNRQDFSIAMCAIIQI